MNRGDWILDRHQHDDIATENNSYLTHVFNYLLSLLRREKICLEDLFAYVPSLKKIEKVKIRELSFRKKGKLINKVPFQVPESYLVLG